MLSSLTDTKVAQTPHPAPSPCSSTSCQFAGDGKEAAGGGHLCHCLCGFGMGATCIATIWERSHLGELGDALTFPLHLEEGSLQSRGGDMRIHSPLPPRPAPKLCAGHLPITVGGRTGEGCGWLRVKMGAHTGEWGGVKGRGGCNSLRRATIPRANRLSSTAMMGIPTFLKVSRGLRGLRKGGTSARRKTEGGVCSEHSEPSPTKTHSPLLLADVTMPWEQSLQARLRFVNTSFPTSSPPSPGKRLRVH